MVGPSLPELKANLARFLELGGLTEWERGALVHLFLNGTVAAPEVAVGAGIPKNKVYDVLEALEKKGLAFRPSVGPKKMYRAVRPEEMFERLMEGPNKMGELRSLISGFLVEVYEGALEGVAEVSLEQLASVTDNRVAINSMLHDAFKESSTEVRLVAHSFTWLAESQALITAMRDRATAGVSIKLLATKEQRLPKKLKDGGFEARAGDIELAPSICIDNALLLQFVRKGPTKATDSPEIVVRIHNPDLARDARRSFDEAWLTAKEAEYDAA